MYDTSNQRDLLIDLFNLTDDDIESVRYENQIGSTLLYVTLKPRYMACPTCGNKAVKIKGYVPKKITHSVLTNRSCQILYKARRYVCPVCGHTYYEENPFVFKKMKISIFTVKKILEDLHNFNETFTSVANRYNISPTSACSIFDQHIDIPRKPFPRYINFDEVYAFKSAHSKYVCVILDYMNQTPVDVLPSRREDFLKEYFDRIPKEERDQVKVCCFDMYKTYRTICRRYFKNAILVVDRFHVSQELHRRLNQIRIDVMKTVNRKKLRAQREKQYDRDAYKEYIKYDRQYYLLKKFNWLLLKDPDDEKIFDIFAEGKKNLKFDRTMNFYELREELLRIDPLLKEAYELKNVFSKFYKESVSTTAKRNLEEII